MKLKTMKKQRKLELQKSPNKVSCLPTAFAMALGVNVNELIRLLGHDGTAIWWPEQIGAARHRGFHVQELIDFCMINEVAVTCIEGRPTAKPNGEASFREYTFDCSPEARFKKYLDNNMGVLVGTVSDGQGHAVAWDGEQIYCPAGIVLAESDFEPREFYILQKQSV